MTKQCQKCSRSFVLKPKVRKDTKYCEECRWMTCEVCKQKKRMTTQQIENPTWGRYCSHKCEKANSNFRFKKNGYWCIKAEDHPRAYERGYYYEHILLAEKKIGRLLNTDNETVHHIDGDKLNNDPENLKITTRVDHSSHHWPTVSWSEDVGIDHKSFSKHIKKPSGVQFRQGYKTVFEPDNPMSNLRGYVVYARKVMAKHLDRLLSKDEIVIHIDGDKTNDAIDNLRIVRRSVPFPVGEKCERKGHVGFAMEHGYVVIWNPTHPMARKTGYVAEHRLIMADHLGRNLKPYEHVHHINGNRQDNRLENLELLHRKNHPSKHFRR